MYFKAKSTWYSLSTNKKCNLLGWNINWDLVHSLKKFKKNQEALLFYNVVDSLREKEIAQFYKDPLFSE